MTSLTLTLMSFFVAPFCPCSASLLSQLSGGSAPALGPARHLGVIGSGAAPAGSGFHSGLGLGGDAPSSLFSGEQAPWQDPPPS